MKRLTAALALAIAVTLVGPANADDQRIRLRGTITTVDHDTLSLSTASGPATILLSPTTRLAYVVKADFSAIKAGTAIGTVAVTGPDGMLRAREVQIFLPSAVPPFGSQPWDSEPGSSMINAPVSTMTDAKVDNVAGHVLTISLPSGDKQVFVPPTVPVVTFAAADRSALVTGAHVIVFAVKHDDGSMTISSVQVGQNGLVPPM